MTGQREVRRLIPAAVLARDYVLGVEAVVRLVFLAEPAVLAPVARAISDEVGDAGVHSPGLQAAV
jgi:hypothetical protein